MFQCFNLPSVNVLEIYYDAQFHHNKKLNKLSASVSSSAKGLYISKYLAKWSQCRGYNSIYCNIFKYCKKGNIMWFKNTISGKISHITICIYILIFFLFNQKKWPCIYSTHSPCNILQQYYFCTVKANILASAYSSKKTRQNKDNNSIMTKNYIN